MTSEPAHPTCENVGPSLKWRRANLAAGDIHAVLRITTTGTTVPLRTVVPVQYFVRSCPTFPGFARVPTSSSAGNAHNLPYYSFVNLYADQRHF